MRVLTRWSNPGPWDEILSILICLNIMKYADVVKPYISSKIRGGRGGTRAQLRESPIGGIVQSYTL